MLVWLGRLIRVQTMNTIRGADRVRQARVSVSPVGPMNWAGGAYRTAELIDREPDPSHAVIGLRNHGITATGDTLTEILDRIESDILRQVPMT